MRRPKSNSGNHGSIPVIFIIAIGLGTLVIPSIYHGQSAARRDLEVQMNEQATQIASSAIEEVFLKIVKGSKECLDRMDGEAAPKTQTYHPEVTRYMVERAYPGAEVGNVVVMATLLQEKGESRSSKDLEELLTAVPAFRAAGAGGHDLRWKENPRLQGLDLSGVELEARGLGKAFLDRELEKGGDGKYHARKAPTAADQIDERMQKDGKLIGDAVGEIATAFERLRPVGPGHSLQEFKAEWENVMRAITRRAEMRIQSAGGDPKFAVVTLLGALAKGSRPNRFTPGENDFRFATVDNPLFKVSRSLVTAEATAKVKNGLVDAEQKVTVHRIVQSSDFKAVYDRVRLKVALYLIAHYDVTAQDLVSLGWIDLVGNKVQPKERLLYPMSARFPDVPSPRVRPFQVAAASR